jgi:hypothetical protein
MRAYLLPLVLVAPWAAAETEQQWPRLAGQILVGSAGFEPGVAGEWTFKTDVPIRVRPELFISTHHDPGIGCSVTWAIAEGKLPNEQRLFIGPRLAYHNDDHRHGNEGRGRGDGDNEDHFGWEASAFGYYEFPIVPSHPGHHYIEAIGGLGILEKHDDPEFGVTIGAAYAYQF